MFENKIPVRGRKLETENDLPLFPDFVVRKQNPREGTETYMKLSKIYEKLMRVRKQNPREGTETHRECG